MKKIISKEMPLDEFYDELFGLDISFTGPQGLRSIAKIPVAVRQPVRRYAVHLSDYFDAEMIHTLDRRLKRIGEKRDFVFGGSFGGMSLVVDIELEEEKKEVAGFRVALMIMASAIDIRDNTAETDLLADISVVMHEEEVTGAFDEAVDGVKKLVGDRAYPKAVYDFLRLFLDRIAEEPGISYDNMIVAQDRETGEKISVFPGITKKE